MNNVKKCLLGCKAFIVRIFSVNKSLGAVSKTILYDSATDEYDLGGNKLINIDEIKGVTDEDLYLQSLGTGKLKFRSEGGDISFISDNDLVGIGTLSPVGNMDVVSGSHTRVIANNYNDDATFPILAARKNAGVDGTPTAVQSGMALGMLDFEGYGATGAQTFKCGIKGYAAENWTDAAMGNKIVFFNTPVGSSTATEKVLVGYDVVVNADGTGDYSDISTAIDALTGGESVYITGDFTETTTFNLDVDNIRIHWDNVTLTLNDARFLQTGDYNYFSGVLEITGTGQSSDRTLFSTTGDWFNNLSCEMIFNPTSTTGGSGNNLYCCTSSGSNCSFRMSLTDWTGITEGTGSIVVIEATNSRSALYINIDTVTINSAATAIGMNLGTTETIITSNMHDITNAGAGSGYGWNGGGGQVGNTHIGIVDGCDVDYNVAGADNNVAALNT